MYAAFLSSIIIFEHLTIFAILSNMTSGLF
jgi:hypothetical protein